MKAELRLGGPGTGKTTELLNEVEKALDEGVAPSQIAFCSFTKAAVNEAINRACEKFHLEARDLPYFRTIHSLCFKELGMTRGEVLGPEHLRELSELTGEELSDREDPLAPALGSEGDELLFLDQLARSRHVQLNETWSQRDEHTRDVDWHRLDRFARAYSKYRVDRSLSDFADLLERYVAGEGGIVPVKRAIIDEGQDLTPIQWRVVRRAFAHVEHLIVAGDDKQAVHRWAGAAVEEFLALPYARSHLAKSHRVPRAVFDLSHQVARRISHQYPNPWQPTDKAGSVDWLASPEEADMSQGEWLVLARARSQLGELAMLARQAGVFYSLKGEPSVPVIHVRAIMAYESLRRGERVGPDAAALVIRFSGKRGVRLEEKRDYSLAELGLSGEMAWHDALAVIALADREYYLACRRRGEKLLKPPRVRIETLHGAKGTEAPNVLLLTDLTRRTARGLETDPDSEHRCFYVGLTRARERLCVVEARGRHAYQL